MRKLIQIGAVGFLLTFIFGINALAADNSAVPRDVLSVAEDWVSVVQSHMSSDPAKWGFADTAEIERLVLGNGYQVKFVGAAQLSVASGKEISELIDTNIIETWEFTLNLDENPKIFLTVAYEDGAYRVVHFGGDAQIFGETKSNLAGLLRDNDLTMGQELLSASGIYYFIATGRDQKEFVLPASEFVTFRGKAANSELLSIPELTQSLKDMKLASENGVRGGFISEEVSVNRQKDTSYHLLTASTLVFFGIVIVAFVYFRQKRKSK